MLIKFAVKSSTKLFEIQTYTKEWFICICSEINQNLFSDLGVIA